MLGQHWCEHAWDNASELTWPRTIRLPVIHLMHFRPPYALSTEEENSTSALLPCQSPLCRNPLNLQGPARYQRPERVQRSVRFLHSVAVAIVRIRGATSHLD